MDRPVFRLNDSVIAQIVRILQLGILSGTDISDHMRQMVLETSTPGVLKLTPEYMQQDAKNIETMFEHLEDMMEPIDGSTPSN